VKQVNVGLGVAINKLERRPEKLDVVLERPRKVVLCQELLRFSGEALDDLRTGCVRLPVNIIEIPELFSHLSEEPVFQGLQLAESQGFIISVFVSLHEVKNVTLLVFGDF
jgi:hypothetical protein